MLGAHQTANRKLHKAENLSVLHGNFTAATLNERLCGQCHIGIIVTDNEQIMRVMGNRLSKGTMDAKALYKAVCIRTGIVMALKDKGLEKILRRIGSQAAINNGCLGLGAAGNGGAGGHYHRPHGSKIARKSLTVCINGRNVEGILVNLDGNMHGVRHP